MQLTPLPDRVAFWHEDGRDGFEIVIYEQLEAGHVLRGATTAVEDGHAWSVSYEIVLDKEWQTMKVTATALSTDGERAMTATRSDDTWVVDGAARPDLAGCVDIDFESSLVTNALPIHRLPADGSTHDVPAAFVRAGSLKVERLEQSYRYAGPAGAGHTFDYESPTFDVSCRLSYDGSGLILTYPGLGRRHQL
jgi:hypothetical protein